jgi:hypothetical protein
MEKLFTALLSCVAVACLMTPVAFAQTADGVTPAEETVCDPLNEAGVTKGLYGLCVAFCEAQDLGDENGAITEAELGALDGTAPSGKILLSYNRKMQELDPPMPCLIVQEPCPCFSAEELESIDGLIPGQNGSTTAFRFNCTDGDPVDPLLTLVRLREFDAIFTVPPTFPDANVAVVGQVGETDDPQCRYTNTQGVQLNRILSIEEGTLSTEQWSECRTQLRARITATGLQCN